jgi:hypothetical protein
MKMKNKPMFVYSKTFRRGLNYAGRTRSIL